MKKICLILMLFMSITIGAKAQTAYETPKFFDNVYAGVEVGAQTPLSFNQMFPLNTAAGLKVGKDFSPVFGANIEGLVTFNNHINGHTAGFANNYLSDTFVSMVNVGVNGTVNLFNLFGGYKGEPRFFDINTVTGLGWAHLYGIDNYVDNALHNKKDYFTAKTGVDFNFNLGEAKAWQVYIEPSVLWLLNTNGGVQFNKHNALLQLSAGVNYKFKTSNGTHNFRVYNIGAMNEEINSLRAELAKKPKEVVKTVTEVKKDVIEKQVGNITVYFSENSSELTDNSKKVLDNIKEGTAVSVYGYASETGSSKYNQSLSEKRANAVSEYLKARNVNVTKAVGHGETGYPVARVVIVEVQ